MTYASGTLTTTYGNNIVVTGKINNIPNATINYISGLTSDAQTQINTKANTTDLTTTNTNLQLLTQI